MDRISKLRSRIFDGLLFSNEFYYFFYKEYDRLSDQPELIRYAESFYYAFSNLTPSIGDGELIVGHRDYQMPDDQLAEWETVYKPIGQARVAKAGQGQDSHMTIDYDLLLNKGISGIIEEIERYIDILSNNPDTANNCDEANCSKVVEAAQEQLAAIRMLKERGMLEQLPQKLQQAAIAREENPSASLTELAAMMEPPITKPAMNHRLKKLVAMTKEG
jgi:hypothetical protein